MSRLLVSSFLAVAVLLSGVSGQIDDNSTEAPMPNDCDGIVPGNVYFTYLRSTEPAEVVLLPFEDIPGNMTLYLTDNAWTGSSFQSDEGTLEMTTPLEGIPGGTNFGYGPSVNLGQDWVAIEGAFALDLLGDQVFLYCLGSEDVVPIAAISNNGPFQAAGFPSYGKNESALPETLATNGTIVLPGPCGTWEYAGTKSTEINVLKSSIINVDNWKGQSCTGSGGFSMRMSWTQLLLVFGLGSTLLY